MVADAELSSNLACCQSYSVAVLVIVVSAFVQTDCSVKKRKIEFKI